MRNEHEVRVVRHMVTWDLESIRKSLDIPRSGTDVARHARLLTAQEVLSWVLGAPLPWLESVLEDEKAAHRCP